MTNRGKKPTNKFISDRLHEEKAILDRQQEEERDNSKIINGRLNTNNNAIKTDSKFINLNN